MKNTKKIVIFLVIIFLICIAKNVVIANNSVDIAKSSSIELTFSIEQQPVNEAEFKIYKIANISENFEVSLTEKFKNYDISIETLNSDNLRKLSRNISNIYKI